MNNSDSSNKAAIERYPKPGWLYDQISGDEDARVCKDISEEACAVIALLGLASFAAAFYISRIKDVSG